MQTNTGLQQKLKEAEEGATAQEARNVVAATAAGKATEKIKQLSEEIQELTEVGHANRLHRSTCLGDVSFSLISL